MFLRMSEHHGGHHGGDMGGGPQNFGGPPDVPGASGGFGPFGPADQHDNFRDSPTFYSYRRGGRVGFRYRPRPGSPGWVVLWVVRVAVIALFVYIAVHVASGMGTSAP
jgi:hypothetical protein